MNDPLASSALASALTETTGMGGGRYGNKTADIAIGLLRNSTKAAQGGGGGQGIGSVAGGIIGTGIGAYFGSPQVGASLGSAAGGLIGAGVDRLNKPSAPDQDAMTRAKALHLLRSGAV